MYSSPNVKGKMLGGKCGGQGEGFHILASMRWYVALSFWILLSTLDRQLNKKTHRLPMCLHRSWFSWKQWESWNTEHAKPWSGVWGWVHRIYTGPQARMGKRLCAPRASNCGGQRLHQLYQSSHSDQWVLTSPLSPVQSQLGMGKQGVTWLIPSHARWYIRSPVAHLCAPACKQICQDLFPRTLVWLPTGLLCCDMASQRKEGWLHNCLTTWGVL